MNFTDVSESPGVRVTAEALRMLETRYALAAELAGAGRDVLEVGCAAGMGLGWLARSARRVVGGDSMRSFLEDARRHFGTRVPLACLDAQALPFRSGSFDLVLLCEAIYYLPRAREFVLEARRVLKPGGTLFICSANREWVQFNPSPLATRYWSANELQALLDEGGFDVSVKGGFRDADGSAGALLMRTARRIAIRANLIPKTMRGKEALKRLFSGALRELPRELTNVDERLVGSLVPILPGVDPSAFKVLYAIATVRS